MILPSRINSTSQDLALAITIAIKLQCIKNYKYHFRVSFVWLDTEKMMILF